MFTKKEPILELLQDACEVEQNYLAGLTPFERQAGGKPERWSPKDTLAHIAEWKMTMTARLEAYLQDRDGPAYADVDGRNAEIFERHRRCPWDEVAAMLARSCEGLQAAVRLLSDDMLLAPARFPWQHGETLRVRIPFNAFFHPLVHIAQLYAGAGDRLSGDGLIESMVHGMCALDDSPAFQARWIYVRGAYYAAAGDHPKALASLSRAFAARPDLIAASLKDGDLQGLRDDPQFRALIGR